MIELTFWTIFADLLSQYYITGWKKNGWWYRWNGTENGNLREGINLQSSYFLRFMPNWLSLWIKASSYHISARICRYAIACSNCRKTCKNPISSATSHVLRCGYVDPRHRILQGKPWERIQSNRCGRDSCKLSSGYFDLHSASLFLLSNNTYGIARMPF